MDILSDVLRVIRLTGAVFFTARFSAPWSLASPASTALAPMLGKRADCISLFHILVEGECWFSLEGHAPVRVETGAVVVIPHGDAHVMGYHPDCASVPIESILTPSENGEIPHVEHGGGGEEARFVCGYLHGDHRFNPLIGALPRLLVVSAGASGDEAADVGDEFPVRSSTSDHWLEMTLDRAVEEADARRPGSPAMLSRLTELLYLEVLRRHMQQLPEGQTGWLAGVRDPQVGRALRLLHEQPERKWNTEDLGRAVGLSRSALGQHFTTLVGDPPMRYLTGWRMQLAQHLLLTPRQSITSIAASVGYESDVAFSRAFKRHTGVPPATWRRQARGMH
ncbi:MAG: AraC family transcriptional regulator [Gemmatimonadota bacterium]